MVLGLDITWKRLKLDPCLIPYTKMGSKLIYNLNVTAKLQNSQKKT